MTTKKKTPARSTPITPIPKQAAPYHRLDMLLRTMRSITQHEDALCELSHEVRRSGVLTPSSSKELRAILETIPSHDFLHDLDTVRDLLVPSPATKKSAAIKVKKSIKPAKKPSK